MNAPGRDTGLQPERTSLAWGRTMTALVGASLLFLRWIPAHGGFAGVLVAAALATALAIYLSQRRRYARSVAGVTRGGRMRTLSRLCARPAQSSVWADSEFIPFYSCPFKGGT